MKFSRLTIVASTVKRNYHQSPSLFSSLLPSATIKSSSTAAKTLQFPHSFICQYRHHNHRQLPSSSSLSSSASNSNNNKSNNHNDDHKNRSSSSPSVATEAASVEIETVARARDFFSRLPTQYVRAADLLNYDSNTHQRIDVSFDVVTGKPKISKLKKEKKLDYSIEKISIKQNDDKGNEEDYYEVLWSDSRISHYSFSWLRKQLNRWDNRNSNSESEEKGIKKERPADKRKKIILWSTLTEKNIRDSSTLSIPFSDLVSKTTTTTIANGDDDTSGNSNNSIKLGLSSLYRYGILLVTGTPINDDGAGVAALGAAFGGGSIKKSESATSVLANYQNGGTDILLPHGTDGPLRTLYGTVWSTSSAGQADGASVADSAYGNDGLPLHTDMTYFRDPPGLQIFTMVQPAINGGESVFADGYAIAEQLRSDHPAAFRVLSNTVRKYRCIDKETGWYLEASGPMIQTVKEEMNTYDDGGGGTSGKSDHRYSRGGRIVGIRHNDLDRLPDLPPSEASAFASSSTAVSKEEERIDAFYDNLEYAHNCFDELLAKDSFRLIMKLQPGDTMVVANQRCFHGRCAFESSIQNPRSVMGCYISQDELLSRFRMEGFDI